MPVPMRTTFHRAEAKYNVTTEFPSLGLHSAAATGNVGLVEYALNNGQPINSVLDGVLPLHAACAGGNVQVVKLLIDHGADVNAPRLPRKYSNDKGRDASAPIVGTSGSTPLHFAAANGNSSVISLLLLHGALADRPDKHGVTPEMLAQQNGWMECAKILSDWIINKDRDLREREGYTVKPASSPGRAVQHSPEASSSSPRRRLQMKQSIDTALNLLKSPDPNLKAAQPIHSLTPPSSPDKSFGEYTFYPVDPNNNSPIDPGSRRPSLPHLPQPLPNNSQQISKLSSPSEHPMQRRPRSAGTGADRRQEQQEQEIMYPVYGRGGSGRRLGSKYSLLNIFKKSQPGEGLESSNSTETGLNSESMASTGPVGSTITLPLPVTPGRSGQTSTFDSPEPSGTPASAMSGPPSRLGFLTHRGSDASTRSNRFTPQIQPHTPEISPGNFQASPRNVPLAVELHLALAQQQHRAKANSPPHADTPTEGSEKGKLSSPLAKLNALLLPSHNRTRSGSSGSMPDSQDDEALHTANTSFEPDSGKPSPSPRPGILRGHTRTSSSGQGASPLNSRTLRFDSTSSSPSTERKGRDSPRSVPAILRSHGSLTKMNIQTTSDGPEVDSRAELAVPSSDSAEKHTKDETPYHEQVLDPVNVLSVPSVPLQRQRGLSFASSSESSLSPILSSDNANDPSLAVLNSDFPFSINRPPSLLIEGQTADVVSSSPGHLSAPLSSDSRNRGDSLSSNSTSDSRSNMMSSSGSGTSVTISTPGMSSLLMSPPDLVDVLKYRERPPVELEGENISAPAVFPPGLNERRAHGPLDIDVASISSHAQAEALVERARQDVLDLANAQEVFPINGGGRSPLSARLAAYGESLALERKLREQKEEENSWNDRVQDRLPPLPSSRPAVASSPVTGDISRQKSRDGVERQLSLENRAGRRVKRRPKDPRRPSTADSLSSHRQDMFFADRSISHQSSRSTSTSHYPPTPTTYVLPDESTVSQDPHIALPHGGQDDSLTSEYSPAPAMGVTPIATSDESLSRINSLDTADDTETDSSPTIHRVLTAPLSNPSRGKREQVRSATKLTRMGYPVADQAAAARTAPPTPPATSRMGFGVLKSFMQTTFKGKP
ncbi:hypothetical protein M413DRAFT_441701 [Hebeloma cylindrosporum]|uniref:Uncharacterized protein n=1 Tax=Hebeloma cylindrosporum TaxID=76867 RepID=A0A0C2Y5E4_HEBCY|nr:hypothetical protein M413DRAFT_441701 [Hebeloma cylindrosporum h7]